jgi:hypothetical protein
MPGNTKTRRIGGYKKIQLLQLVVKEDPYWGLDGNIYQAGVRAEYARDVRFGNR